MGAGGLDLVYLDTVLGAGALKTSGFIPVGNKPSIYTTGIQSVPIQRGPDDHRRLTTPVVYQCYATKPRINGPNL